MSIALDVGSMRMRSLRRVNYRLIGRSCRSEYVSLADNPSCRRVLDRLNATYAPSERELVVYGDTTDDVSELLHVPTVALLPGGRIPDDDPAARQVIAANIESLLPRPQHEGEYCCFTTGGVEECLAGDETREHAFLSRVIRLHGYQPLALGSATAVVLAELVRESLTGVGITFGAASCEASLVRHGVELANCTVRRGGRWIDEQLARHDEQYIWDHDGHRYLDVRQARRWKESTLGSVLEPTSARHRLFGELLRELVREVLQTARQAFSPARIAGAVSRPVSVVCCGGTASHRDFRDLVLEVMQTAPLPVDVKEVNVVDDWEYTVARGCLIRAVLEAETATRRVA